MSSKKNEKYSTNDIDELKSDKSFMENDFISMCGYDENEARTAANNVLKYDYEVGW